jgi:hypothetical protein
LNRAAAIHNIKQLRCPPLHQYLENTYRTPVNLVVNNHQGDDVYLSSEEGATQGDVAAMQMYGIAMKPLVDKLGQETDPALCKQGWYADDASATGQLKEMKKWWDLLSNTGPKYGYFPNGSKTILILKNKSHSVLADTLFKHTGIKVVTDGERHLGAVVGTEAFREKYVTDKVAKWVSDIDQLSEIAKDEPHVAYTAFTKGICHRWGFLQRTVKDISHLFAPLEKAIFGKLLPTITGRSLTTLEQQIVQLPVRYGGLGISNPRTSADQEYENSTYVTEALTEQIFNQDQSASVDLGRIMTRKKVLEQAQETEYLRQFKAICEHKDTSSRSKRLLELAREKGAGAWLTALPIQSLGYAFNEEDFRGSLSIRYGWRIKNMPMHCACGNENSIDHSLSCHTGGYPIFRHNMMRDIIADILREICKDVQIEPELIPIASDFSKTSRNNKDKARLDVSSVGLWSPRERNMMDIRVFHPNAPSYMNKTLKSLFKTHEQQKKREYNSRVINKEKSTFTPMVFSTFGGMSKECLQAIRRAAGVIAEKRKEKYSDVMGHLSTMLRMCMLKSVLLSVRGSRGRSKGTSKPLSTVAFNLIPKSQTTTAQDIDDY